jgi:hypothetical protein
MNSRPFLVSLCCLLQMSAGALAQNLPLDKLSDCNFLDQTLSTLQQPVSRSCRSPRNQLEERLMSNLRMSSRLNACLLAAPPAARLKSFSCIDLDIQGNRELVCFRPIDDSVLRKYQDNYDPALSYRYKEGAANCPSTNRDASEAPNSLFPQLLYPIAKASFGFVVGLGDSRVPLARAYHGFGSVAPDLALSGSAIEVFDVAQYKSGQENPGVADSTDSDEDWKFQITDMPKEAQRDFARPFEEASGERIGVRIRMITISTNHTSSLPFRDRKDDLDSWQQAIASYLKDEGFRSLTRQELASTPFRNTDAMRDFMVKHMPYGSSDFIRRTLGPHLVFLVNDDDNDCNKVAEALVAEPEEGVKNDHGGMGFMVFTVGRCRDGGSPDAVLDDVIQRETEILEKEAKRP